MTHPIFDYGNALADAIAALHPVDATLFGVAGNEDRLDDYSPDGIANDLAKHREWLSDIAAMPPTDDYWEALAGRVIVESLQHSVSSLEEGEAFRKLNNIASPVQDLAMVFEVMDHAAGWEQVIPRLGKVGAALAGYQATLREGSSQGLVAAKRQVAAVIKQLDEYAKSAFSELPAAFEKAGAPGGSAVGTALESAIQSARQAFGTMRSYLSNEYMSTAADADPVGPERHQASAERFLGTSLDAAETYAWGWTEVSRLWGEMTAVAGQIKDGASVPEAVALVDGDPARASRDREHFIELLTELQLKALADLDGMAFRIPVEAREITVNISPPGSTLGAQYISPSEDFSRPGSVWYGLEDDEHQIPIHKHISTNYHEGFPGHHLQSVYQLANAERLTRFHRTFVWYSGAGEGWALYSERLMLELGYFDRPEYILNTHAESMLRACRVVIDIGSHHGFRIPDGQPFHPGEEWTFETAVEMLTTYALQPQAYARSEVTRYLGWPGQAIAYKVGEREILGMRKALEACDGAAFDLIEFHHKVLTPGAIGLTHLRDLVVG